MILNGEREMEDLSFGQWLSRQRKSMGLTQKQLAARVNCATITVRKLEAGQRRPSIQVVEQLAQALDIPIEEKNHFIHFALGQENSASLFHLENYPWQVATASLRSRLVASLLEHLGQEHQFSPVNNFFLDKHIHRFNPLYSAQFSNLGANLRLTHDLSSEIHNSIIILMLVPVEIPSDLALTLMQNSYPAQITGDNLLNSK
jgi:transcriptional regulator with XRE-family HTH domain